MAASSWTSARLLAIATLGAGFALSKSFLHPLLKKIAPKQGEGPSREAMLGGHYKHTVLGYAKTKNDATDSGEHQQQTVVVGEISDPNRDPGYWGTSRMVLEAGLCLALNQEALKADTSLIQGGVLTPATAMGGVLMERLRGAGIEYKIVETRQVTV